MAPTTSTPGSPASILLPHDHNGTPANVDGQASSSPNVEHPIKVADTPAIAPRSTARAPQHHLQARCHSIHAYHRRQRRRKPPLLFVSKQIRAESRPLYYALKKFCCHSTDYDSTIYIHTDKRRAQLLAAYKLDFEVLMPPRAPPTGLICSCVCSAFTRGRSSGHSGLLPKGIWGRVLRALPSRTYSRV